ncbi:alkyl hydroperoxide reductase subunit F [Oxalobacter vibrioformis]|uniref:Alkyl hydroperoxide reductase subunit F n=1 Tax=Oxalobacter vibrioformis TaxID=933080 RepID=A0A9E9P1Y2_9BURK|nr:alkyl hydroperoxide reductase subunit F [Oxalobacter vibrioformis]WAW09342.1 alkyl hydroperoxide reductase subunit F [Oxalobacter vibrioformis]
MLDKHLKDQLKTYLEKLAQPIEITISTDDSAKSREMLQLLHEIRDLSPHVRVIEKKDDPGRKPAFTMTRPGENTGISFASIPMGHEFTSFVLALLQTGGHPPKADPEVIEQIKNLEGEFHFETFVSLTCQNCPEVVQALNLMAVLNPNISHVMIDGALFPDEAAERHIMGVPTVFLNGRQLSTGRMTVKEILALIDTASTEREVQKISAKAPFDVVVIGGGPAASAAAVYAARKGIRTGLVTENFGGQMLNTTTIENLIALKQTEGVKFSAALEENVIAHGVDIMIPQTATKLIPGKLIEIRMESGATIKSKTVILAPGARFRQLGIEGESQYIGRGVAFCAHCDGPLYKNKQVAVIGGGNAAVEAAIDLAGITEHVTLLARNNRMEADIVLQEKLKKLPNVTIKTDALVFEVTGEHSRVNGLMYRDLTTDMTHNLKLEGIFVQIGQQPATKWLSGIVDLNAHGEIIVDDHARTSVPGVFAAGDATTVPFKQIIIAMGNGATAALSAFDYLLRN